ncbi:MAG: hypothetical protein V1717_01615 [Candidatus Micrarchaeota archaeon]
MKKSQGMFEYILLLAGILLIVVLAIVLLRGGIFQGAQQDIQIQNCQAALARSSACYNADGSWNSLGEPTPFPPACAGIVAYADGACGTPPGGAQATP